MSLTRKQKAIEKARRRRLDEAQDYVLSDPRGRAFIQHLIDRARLDSSAMQGNSMGVYLLAQQEFMRAVLFDLRARSLQKIRLMEDETIAQRNLDKADVPSEDDADGTYTGTAE